MCAPVSAQKSGALADLDKSCHPLMLPHAHASGCLHLSQRHAHRPLHALIAAEEAEGLTTSATCLKSHNGLRLILIWCRKAGFPTEEF